MDKKIDFIKICRIQCNDYDNEKLTNNELKCFVQCSNFENNYKYICEKCGANFYKIDNDIKNNDSYINCYKSLEGYYLDNSLYKLCYLNCKNCDKEGNETDHNCIKCNDDYNFQMNLLNHFNCYNKCPYYHYFDKILNKTFCTNNLSCSDNYSKLIINKSECVDDCSRDSQFIYEYEGICYDYNQIIYTTQIPTIKITQIDFKSNLIKPEFKDSTNIFDNNENKTEIINRAIIITSEYLSDNDKYNHIENNINYKFIESTNIFDNNENKIEIINSTIIISYEYISDSDKYNHIENNINHKFKNNPEYKEKIENIFDNISIYNIIENNTIFEELKENILNNINISDILNGNDIEVKEENILISISTTDNQNNNLNQNKTTINLGECQNKIKSAYNISLNNSLYILKIDKTEEGMKIPKIEYEIYYPLFNKELIKLNLTSCKDSKIKISIPVSINDDLDKYNSSSDYYNDICSKTTSKSGTDICLADRKVEFINNNMTLCEEDCDLIDYNYTTEKVKCSCLVKINLPIISEIKFDKKKLFKF